MTVNADTSPGNGPERRIVVGVDGSGGSLAALRWALAEAAATGTVAEVVHCYQAHSLSERVLGSTEERQRGSMCMLQNEVTAALTQAPQHPHVRQTSRRGSAAAILRERSVGADLLVLGTHGHSTLHDVAFGTVVTSSVKHANCAVVVVREDGSVATPQSARLAASDA